MRVFDCELTAEIIAAIAAHGERDYPSEACGLVLGVSGAATLDRVVQLKNMQDRYHKLDPVQFPRTARDAFRLDELERMKVLKAAESDGLVERILYHSHPDAGAYFSPEDRAAAVHEGIELMPGVINVVVSVRDGSAADMAAFLWQPGKKAFDEARIPLDGEALPLALPDLELRTMEGSESARPIPPVQPGLRPRWVSPGEREVIEALAEGRRLPIDGPAAANVDRLGRGVLSPLSGFARSATIATIEGSGRLLGGTPWRVPITLEVSAHHAPELGSVTELVDPGGRVVAAMGIAEVTAPIKGRVRCGGPVFVYRDPADSALDAPELRAELLRRGMGQVLAVPAAMVGAASEVPWQDFDGFCLAEPSDALPADRTLPAVGLHGDGGWLDAAIAQNFGATHIWVDGPSTRRRVAETLAIEPWRP